MTTELVPYVLVTPIMHNAKLPPLPWLHGDFSGTNDMMNSQQPLLADVFWKYTFGTIMGVMSFLSMLQNGMIIVYFCKRSVHMSSSKHIISMAVADMFTAVTVGPLYTCVLYQRSCIDDMVAAHLSAFSFSATFLNIEWRSQYLCILQNDIVSKVLYIVLLLNCLIPIVLTLQIKYENIFHEDFHVFKIELLAIFVIVVYLVLFIVTKWHQNKVKIPLILKGYREN